MRVIAKHNTFDGAPSEIFEAGNTLESQTLITVGKEYEVHAMCLYDKILSLQIIDDSDCPSWLPCWLFEMRDPTICDDWICNIFPDDQPRFVLGPNFIADDQSSYCNMIELDPQAVELFWSRIAQRS